MEYDISALAARYGNRMTINVIGQSLDGRNIYDIIIGNLARAKRFCFREPSMQENILWFLL